MEEYGSVMEVIYCKNYEMLDIPNKNGCYIDENGTKAYYMNNLYHREDGPAIEWSWDSKSWFLFDLPYSEDEYNKLVSNLPLLYWKHRMGIVYIPKIVIDS